MTSSLRWGLWITALAGSSALLLFSDEESTTVGGLVSDVPVRRVATAATPSRTEFARAEEEILILALRPRQGPARVVDSFGVHDWTPPSVAPIRPPSPIAPTAPPLPYTVLGKQYSEGVWRVFLARQDRIFVVKPRDTIENVYRVEATYPPVLTLTYLPLNVTQTMAIGSLE